MTFRQFVGATLGGLGIIAATFLPWYAYPSHTESGLQHHLGLASLGAGVILVISAVLVYLGGGRLRVPSGLLLTVGIVASVVTGGVWLLEFAASLQLCFDPGGCPWIPQIGGGLWLITVSGPFACFWLVRAAFTGPPPPPLTWEEIYGPRT